MNGLLAEMAIWAGLGAAAVVAAVVWAWLLGRRKVRKEVDRLREDVHDLLAQPSTESRLVMNGRGGAFVDLAASVNRLLDRAAETPETGEPAGAGGLFDLLAKTLPDVALIHSNVIHYANPSAGELFG
ncbi:MAG: hypothetical protein JXB36_09445, partial [Gammaproteobacteria bacterium]|nr:hypothetical protein [Gammaproteobacteria bacterium]